MTKSKGGAKQRWQRGEKKTRHQRGRQTQMAGQGARQSDRRVKAVQRRRGSTKAGGGGCVVVVVAPSGAVMFAVSLGLSDHPSLPLPASTAAPHPLLYCFLCPPSTISPVRYYLWLHSACPVNQTTPPAPYPLGVFEALTTGPSVCCMDTHEEARGRRAG